MLVGGAEVNPEEKMRKGSGRSPRRKKGRGYGEIERVVGHGWREARKRPKKQSLRKMRK